MSFLHGKIFQHDEAEMHAVVHDEEMLSRKKKNAEENMPTRNMNMGVYVVLTAPAD